MAHYNANAHLPVGWLNFGKYEVIRLDVVPIGGFLLSQVSVCLVKFKNAQLFHLFFASVFAMGDLLMHSVSFC